MKCGDAKNPAGPYIKSNGEPCGNHCSKGGVTRCNLHGGHNKASKIKADQMMAQCRLPAIETLYSLIDQFSRDTCAICGFPKGDTDEKRMIIRACQTTLDRSGMGPHSTLDLVRQTDGDLPLALLTDDERDTLRAALGRINEVKTIVRARQELGDTQAPSVH